VLQLAVVSTQHKPNADTVQQQHGIRHHEDDDNYCVLMTKNEKQEVGLNVYEK